MSAVLLAAALGACSAPPYVHHASEFNRETPGFGQEVKDIANVVICYNSRSASPEQVRTLAVDECGKFGHPTLFKEQRYSDCPISTPTSAVFECVHSNEGSTDEGVSYAPGGGGIVVNYDGIPFRYGSGYTASPLPAEAPAPLVNGRTP